MHLVQQYLDRIEVHNKTLRAIFHVNAHALDTAHRLDAAFSASGKPSGPLHCVAVVVKDAIETAEMPTTGGSTAPFAKLHPPKDSPAGVTSLSVDPDLGFLDQLAPLYQLVLKQS